MKYIGYKQSVVLLCVTSMLVLGGCSKEKIKNPLGTDVTLTSADTIKTEVTEEVGNSELDKVVVTVGDAKITYKEAMVYVEYIKNKYEAMFGKEIWEYNFGGQTFEDLAKEEIINMMTQTAIISGKKEEYNIELTEEEEHNISQSAEKFLEKLTKEDIAAYGFTKEVAEKFYRDNKLYERVYDAESMNVDTQVSNEEARQVNMNYIFLTTTKKNASNETVSMTEEDKEMVLDKVNTIYDKAVELTETITSDDGFLSFAKQYSEIEEVEAIYGTNDNTYSFSKEGLQLKSKELSKVIEKEDGYYILYCVTDFDKDATFEVKEEIIEERQNETFKAIYKEWAKSEEVKVKDKVWNTIRLTNVTEEIVDPS